MMDDKQTVGMSAREGLAAFTAFAKHIKDKPMWLGEGQPMASKLDSIKQRLDELTEATAALNKQLNAEVEDLGAESQLWDWRDTCRQKIANNAPDDLRALLAVADAAVAMLEDAGIRHFLKTRTHTSGQLAHSMTPEQAARHDKSATGVAKLLAAVAALTEGGA